MLVKRVPVKTLRSGDIIFYEGVVRNVSMISSIVSGHYTISLSGGDTMYMDGLYLVDKLVPTTYRMKIVKMNKLCYYGVSSCKVEHNGETFVVNMPRDRHHIPEMFERGELTELTINYYHDTYCEIVNVPRILMKKYYLFINLFTFIPAGNV